MSHCTCGCWPGMARDGPPKAGWSRWEVRGNRSASQLSSYVMLFIDMQINLLGQLFEDAKNTDQHPWLMDWKSPVHRLAFASGELHTIGRQCSLQGLCLPSGVFCLKFILNSSDSVSGSNLQAGTRCGLWRVDSASASPLSHPPSTFQSGTASYQHRYFCFPLSGMHPSSAL